MVNTRPPVITPAIIEAMKRKGYNQSQIADYFGVTRSYVSWVKYNKSGLFSRTLREQVMDEYPWQTGTRFNGASPEKRMRDHGEYMVTNGKGMSERKLQRLRWFYRKLIDDGLVVEFDPGIPPSDGIATGGFAYRPRERSDGDLIIRVNEHTVLTEPGKLIWVLPEVLP